MKIIKDKLSGDLIYPCTIQEIKRYLKEIPKEDLEGIRQIRLSNKKSDFDGGFLRNGRIELLCSVDKDYKKVFTHSKYLKEWEKFGAELKRINGVLYICWKEDNLKKYLKFILFHEVGHNVYYRKHGKPGGTTGEKFCDEYAYKYLKKNGCPS